jgi:hypothetical protein
MVVTPLEIEDGIRSPAIRTAGDLARESSFVEERPCVWRDDIGPKQSAVSHRRPCVQTLGVFTWTPSPPPLLTPSTRASAASPL